MIKKICNLFKKTSQNQTTSKDFSASNKIPTRDDMNSVFIGLCIGIHKNRLGLPYRKIRETKGHNRSPEIDALIKNQGGSLGDPYCMWGMQEVLDELCLFYGVDRSFVRIPKGGSTQTVFKTTPPEFKRIVPDKMKWIFWQLISNPSRGHVGMVTSELNKDSSFYTFEFNTNIKDANEVVRDGEGAGFVTRRLGGTSTMRIIGYVDIYDAIAEVIRNPKRMA
jgi:hypothetical protein